MKTVDGRKIRTGKNYFIVTRTNNKGDGQPFFSVARAEIVRGLHIDGSDWPYYIRAKRRMFGTLINNKDVRNNRIYKSEQAANNRAVAMNINLKKDREQTIAKLENELSRIERMISKQKTLAGANL